MDAALVKLIKNDHRHTFQQRIILDAARQNPLGDDFNPGSRRGAAFEADRVSDRLAGLLTQSAGHPAGSGHSGDSTRFKHDNAADLDRNEFKEFQRDAGGLAGARRSAKEDVGMPADC